MSKNSLARAIKKRRDFAGLTQNEAAKACHLALKTYQRIERGETDIRWSQYQSIIKGLKTTELDLLLDRMEYENPNESDVFSATRLLPQKLRRIFIDLFVELRNELDRK
ncbi:helix-turn-helix domain-containing protein [Vibrio sp. TRT 17S01]|uniref:helix-turn-helix domain-containing protein n=1 Tax=Vibrio sp. TRT 17S01 TaxID=3418505 RepID=UPI003CED58CD